MQVHDRLEDVERQLQTKEKELTNERLDKQAEEADAKALRNKTALELMLSTSRQTVPSPNGARSWLNGKRLQQLTRLADIASKDPNIQGPGLRNGA